MFCKWFVVWTFLLLQHLLQTTSTTPLTTALYQGKNHTSVLLNMSHRKTSLETNVSDVTEKLHITTITKTSLSTESSIDPTTTTTITTTTVTPTKTTKSSNNSRFSDFAYFFLSSTAASTTDTTYTTLHASTHTTDAPSSSSTDSNTNVTTTTDVITNNDTNSTTYILLTTTTQTTTTPVPPGPSSMGDDPLPNLISLTSHSQSSGEVRLDFTTDIPFNITTLPFHLLLNEQAYIHLQRSQGDHSLSRNSSIYLLKLSPGDVYSVKLFLGSSSLNTNVTSAPGKVCNVRQLNETTTSVCLVWRQEGGFDAYEFFGQDNKTLSSFNFTSVKDGDVNTTNNWEMNENSVDKSTTNVTLNSTTEGDVVNYDDEDDDDCDSKGLARVEGCLSGLEPGVRMEMSVFTKFLTLSSLPEVFHLQTKPLRPQEVGLINSTDHSVCFKWRQRGSYDHFVGRFYSHKNVSVLWTRMEPEHKVDRSEINESVFTSGVVNGGVINGGFIDGEVIDGEVINDGRTTNGDNSLKPKKNDSNQTIDHSSSENLEESLIEGCVDDLTAGTSYKFSLLSLSHSKVSGEEDISFTTNSSRPLALHQLNSTISNVCMSWQQHDNHHGFTCHYSLEDQPVMDTKNTEVLQKCKSFTPRMKSPIDTSGLVQMEACVAGVEETGGVFEVVIASFVSVVGSTSKLISLPSSFVAVMKPKGAEKIELLSSGTKKLRLNILPPETSAHTTYNVSYTTKEGRKNWKTCRGECSLGDLHPDSSYHVRVVAVRRTLETRRRNAETVFSNAVEKKIFTIPEKVREAKVKDAGSLMNLTWLPPKQHVNILYYSILLTDSLPATVQCSPHRSNQPGNCSGVLWHAFSDLIGGKQYNVTILPANQGGLGESIELEFTYNIKGTASPAWVIVLALMLLLFVAAALALFFYRRRVSAKCFPMYKSAGPPKVTVTELEIQEPMPMKIRDLPQELHHKHKDSDYIFSKEYELLNERSRKYASTVALNADNKVKNRFIDILAFDHSRVKLSSGELMENGDVNDYINANFIPGHNSKREYIACQGPMKGTIDDFWRMIWDHKVTCVVMLTKLFEKGKEKCVKYWSEGDSQEFADVTVTIETLVSHDFYEKRTFSIVLGAEKRSMTHFWFLTWPDFGVPCKLQLLTFLKEVQKCMQTTHPTVVHCSAGVGRTGTFILLDRVLHRLEHSVHVDLFSVVMEMRQFRCRMVQTEAQYIFAHDCLLEELCTTTSFIASEATYINESFTNESFLVNQNYKPLK